MKTLEYRMKHKLEEVFIIPPNEVGNAYMTLWFKRVTRYLKIMPFVYIVPLSFMLVVAGYLVLGPLTVKLVSLLQYGF